MTNYPVGDFLIQVKNAARAHKKEFEITSTKLIEAVANVLKEEKIIDKLSKKDGKLTIALAYYKKEPVLMDVKLVSKPGLRRYANVDEIKSRPRRNASFWIISTPHGVVSSNKALKIKSGGEVIAEIW